MPDIPGREPLADKSRLLLHRKRPNFFEPLLKISDEQSERLAELLALLYGAETAKELLPEIIRLMRVHHAHKTPEMLELEGQQRPGDMFSERDMVVITYGDLIQSPPRKPLQVLSDVINIFLGDVVSTIHVLPFFPYSSDRGFSVIDFREVDPNLGTWDDIETANTRFGLMFDGVVNHISAQSDWFQEFLNGNPQYQDFFLSYESEDAISRDDLKHILRPRTSPLLSKVQTINGPRYVWTTFSPDQIDLNFRNPVVLLRVLQVLLFYIEKGADLIRIDAATYLWKELGTSCAHLPQTHGIIRLLRAVVDIVAPRVAILTETNVPHQDNISYFGDGNNEAHMVYNFALPPLVLHTFHTGDCRKLAKWANELAVPSTTTTYFNFLDSHDGVGLMGARGLLTDDEVSAMVDRVQAHGGMVSFRTTREGGQSPYELNITWFDALNDPNGSDPDNRKVDRFIASRAIALVLRGVPGIYLPSLTGSQIAPMDPEEITEFRAINRRNLSERAMIEELMNPDSLAYRVASRFRQLAEQRVAIPALHPAATQKILPTDGTVFVLLRRSINGESLLLTLVNVTAKQQHVDVPFSLLETESIGWRDRFTHARFGRSGDTLSVSLPAYGVYWLEPADSTPTR
jgi:glucosylglycerate phosphorylase